MADYLRHTWLILQQGKLASLMYEDGLWSIWCWMFFCKSKQTAVAKELAIENDLAREGVNVQPLKEAQAKKYGYQLH